MASRIEMPSAVTFRLEFQRDGGVCMALPCTTGHPPNRLPVAGFTVLSEKVRVDLWFLDDAPPRV